MDNTKKQSEFSRTKANDAKMGAYYTDVGHCVSIGRFLQFPEDTAEQVLLKEKDCGNSVVLVGGGLVGCETAFGWRSTERKCSLWRHWISFLP